MDENSSKTKGHDTRREEIRLECLKCAVQGSGANGSADNALSRAKMFEAYVLDGEVQKAPDRSWVA